MLGKSWAMFLYGQSNVGRPAKMYKLSADPGRSLKVMAGSMVDRDG